MKINIFTPPKFTRQQLDINYLHNLTNKTWHYSVNGRASIYHILKDLKVNKVLIPVYICSTVLEPLKKLNIKPIFYDLDVEDLNPSLESIKALSQKYNIKVVLVASMYGNPANLVEIEKYCKENNIFLIDDAAQSFGAKLDDRLVGTFGDAGFFSFSPGKPTAGHMGSFFWSKYKIRIKRTKHCFIHYIKWLNFDINRYNIYTKKQNKFLYYVIILIDKVFNIYNDNICEFEKPILGGILKENFSFRRKYHNNFVEKFDNNLYFRVVKNMRGISNNHKFVILFQNNLIALKFINHMKINKIYASNGYKLLSDDLKELPNANKINKCVVELPIEDDKEKMKYLFKKVEEFEYTNN